MAAGTSQAVTTLPATPDADFAGFGGVLRRQAAAVPDGTAFRFQHDDGRTHEATYAELHRRAGAIATAVRDAVGHHTAPALLLYPPGVDYVAGLFGCFYAGVPAVPAFPPDPTRLDRTLPRLLAIIADAGAGLVLTTSAHAGVLRGWLTSVLHGAAPEVLATDGRLGGLDSCEGAPEAVSPERLAVLQYTSGSTGSPRGVMLTHGQLRDNCAQISSGFGVSQSTSAALWLPPYHDMGLIGGILTPIAAGIPVTFTSPTAFLRRPASWLQLVSRWRATVTGAPNFAFDLCARRVKDADLQGVDLSSLEVTFTGAEPVRIETLERFVARFEPYGLRPESVSPCYGLAEATLYVTGAAPSEGWRSAAVGRNVLGRSGAARAAGDESIRTVVSCGSPGPQTRVVIVDPRTRRPRRADEVGEVWVASPSVANGYWRREAETAETFAARTATGEGPFLRTGDLGFMRDGELFITGRHKDLIVVNGQNYYPADIEAVCEAAVPDIRANCGAAFAVESGRESTEHLVVMYETDAGVDEERCAAIIDDIRRCVSVTFGLPPRSVVLVAPRTIPKTSSGKVQRWLCRRQFLAGDLNAVARWPSRATSPATKGTEK